MHLAKEYRDVPADAGGSLMAAFPVGIPAAATNVRFHHQTPPGDVDLQLRCTLPPAAVAALVARVAPVAVTTARGREQASGYYRGPEDEHDFYVGDGPNWFLPESYTVYTTAVGHQDENGSRWDYEAGVAVEPVRGRRDLLDARDRRRDSDGGDAVA